MEQIMRETPFSSKYISENSPEYTDTREKTRTDLSGMKERAFEQYAVECYKEIVAKNGPKMEDELTENFYWTRRDLAEKITASGDPGEMQVLADFFHQIMEDDKIVKGLADAIHSTPDRLPVDQIAGALRDGSISNELLVKILERRIEWFKQQVETFHAEKAQFMDQYKERIRTAIEEGYIPADVDRVNERVDHTDFLVFDPLEETSKITGRTMHDQFQVLIRAGMSSPAERRHTVFHELTHVAAGKVIRLFQSPKGNMSIRHTRTGLQNRNVQMASQNPRLRWLNEAVTEFVALHLSGGEDSYSYKAERKALQGMMAAGVDKSLFLNAYFEDYDPDAPGEKFPQWAALLRTIKEKMGEGALTRLGEKFKEARYH